MFQSQPEIGTPAGGGITVDRVQPQRAPAFNPGNGALGDTDNGRNLRLRLVTAPTELVQLHGQVIIADKLFMLFSRGGFCSAIRTRERDLNGAPKLHGVVALDIKTLELL